MGGTGLQKAHKVVNLVERKSIPDDVCLQILLSGLLEMEADLRKEFASFPKVGFGKAEVLLCLVKPFSYN